MNPLGGMFQEPEQKRTFGQRAMGAVRNFGAGLAGFGPEFIAMQRQEQQQLDEQRQKAMAKDAMTVYQLLNDNKIDDAISLVDKRVQYISELGGDPSDTLEIRQMLTTPGRLDEARQELGLFVQASMENGLLPVPAQPEMINAGDLSDQGQAVMRMPDGSVVARDVAGFRSPAPEAEKPPESFRALEMRAIQGGLTPGSPEFQEFMRLGGSPASIQTDSAREQRIQEYMNLGMSRPQAIAALDTQYTTDPVTGNAIGIDRTTGQARILPVDTGSVPTRAQSVAPVSAEDLAFDPGAGTGFGASFVGLYNSTLGQVPFLPTVYGPEAAAQQLTFLERDAINAMATSSRPAVVEQNRIIQSIPRAMEWTENPDVARSKMTSFVDIMMEQYIDDKRYSADLSKPRELRTESGRRASEIERIMGRILKPDAAEQMFNSINRIEQEVGQIQSISDQELLSMDPSTMTDAQLDAYIQRLSNGGR